MNAQEVKKDFPILKDNNLVYLDNGATTQKPIQVINAIEDFYKKSNANPHRGLYALSTNATNLYENSRKKIAKFINSESNNQIIFTKNATESLNLIAYSYGLKNISRGDEIVLSIMEHHSNLVPWQKVARDKQANLKYMYINRNFEIPIEEIERKITPRTKIVGITHVSNVLGTINPIKKIIEIAHRNGAIVIVDAAQSIPHMRIDVQELNADFLVFSGHKMLSPLGIGILYGKRNLLQRMDPFLMGGDMIEYVYEQETTFAQLPNKFEAGTQNVSGVIGLGAAIEYIENIEYANIQRMEEEVINYAKEELSKLNFIETYWTKNNKNHSSVLSFNVIGVKAQEVAKILSSYGVCIRIGSHCAQPLTRYMQISGTCRASFYFYNTKEDVDKLVIALKKVYDILK